MHCNSSTQKAQMGNHKVEACLSSIARLFETHRHTSVLISRFSQSSNVQLLIRSQCLLVPFSEIFYTSLLYPLCALTCDLLWLLIAGHMLLQPPAGQLQLHANVPLTISVSIHLHLSVYLHFLSFSGIKDVSQHTD